MVKKGQGKKLSSAEQIQLCQWLAEFKKPSEIEELCSVNFKKKIAHSTIIQNYKDSDKWKPLITKMRKKFLDAVMEEPIANKKVRLQRLGKIYNEAMTWYTASISQFGTVEKLELGAALGALRDARVEMEGEKPLIDASTHYYLYEKFKDKSPEQLKKEAEEVADRIINRRNSIAGITKRDSLPEED